MYEGTYAVHPATTSPSNGFWGIDESVRYGASTSILSKTAGIVDTGKFVENLCQCPNSPTFAGTTLILLATDAFKKYQKATGGVMDDATGLLKITTAQFINLQNLFFEINGVRQ